MSKVKIITLLSGLLAALALGTEGRAQSPRQRPPYDSTIKEPAGRVVDREPRSRAEGRLEALKARLIELQMNEMELQARLDDLDYRSSPSGIQRALAFVGSVRPMDELREALRITLEGEKARVKKQLELVVASRESLEASIREAEAALERVRHR